MKAEGMNLRFMERQKRPDQAQIRKRRKVDLSGIKENFMFYNILNKIKTDAGLFPYRPT